MKFEVLVSNSGYAPKYHNIRRFPVKMISIFLINTQNMNFLKQSSEETIMNNEQIEQKY